MTITDLEAILHEISQFGQRVIIRLEKKPVKLGRYVQNLLKQTIGYGASEAWQRKSALNTLG